MTKSLKSYVITIAVLLSASAFVVSARALDDVKAKEERVYVIGSQAYIWGYPIVVSGRSIFAGEGGKVAAPINRFARASARGQPDQPLHHRRPHAGSAQGPDGPITV